MVAVNGINGGRNRREALSHVVELLVPKLKCSSAHTEDMVSMAHG